MNYFKKHENMRLFLVLIFCFSILLNFSAMADLKKGDAPPEFKLPALNAEGELMLKDFEGKIVIIHLWKCQ